jgi:multiple sugar transport system permease protein
MNHSRGGTGPAGKVVASVGRHLVLVGILSLVLLPFLWTLLSSFKVTSEIISATPTLFPQDATLEHYRRLFSTSEYPTYLRNSVVVATGSMLANVCLTVLAGYSIYRCRYPGRVLLSRLIIMVYVFPMVILMVPIFKMMARLDLVDSLWSLVLINVTFAAPFTVWLIGPFFESVPRQVEEAAELDGAGRLMTLFRVVLPLIKPGIATVAIFTFISAWTEYTFANVLIFNEGSKTLPVGLSRFVSQYQVDWGLVTAGAVMTSLPVLVLFAFIGRYFVNSISGAIR